MILFHIKGKRPLTKLERNVKVYSNEKKKKGKKGKMRVVFKSFRYLFV